MAPHIITTDDDSSIRKILQIMLSQAGYDVTACSSGKELFSTLKQIEKAPDCLLLDIKMPEMDGFEVLDTLQKNHQELPVIMLTAFSDLETGMKAIRNGASDYLSKPVRKQELLECVKRVIETAEQRKSISVNSDYQKQLEKQLNNAYTTIMKTTLATIKAFSETLEQKDEYTRGHCTRVRTLSLKLGEYVKLSQEQLVTLEGGALLHDIGKIGIPETILNKRGRLTPEEYEYIKMHPAAGEKIVSHIDLFRPYLSIIRNHHERYDGRGYPDGLSGEDIPLLARIVTIADAYDAMTSSRPYREALVPEFAVEELKLGSGSQFDPQLVDLFIDHEIYQY